VIVLELDVAWFAKARGQMNRKSNYDEMKLETENWSRFNGEP
jgi:hypothetical protein